MLLLQPHQHNIHFLRHALQISGTRYAFIVTLTLKHHIIGQCGRLLRVGRSTLSAEEPNPTVGWLVRSLLHRETGTIFTSSQFRFFAFKNRT